MDGWNVYLGSRAGKETGEAPQAFERAAFAIEVKGEALGPAGRALSDETEVVL